MSAYIMEVLGDVEGPVRIGHHGLGNGKLLLPVNGENLLQRGPKPLSLAAVSSKAMKPNILES